MATTKHSKASDDDFDLDGLLESLSPEELKQLEQELIDPDVSLILLENN